MNEQLFIQTLNHRAKAWGLNPLLLLSGIEGLYTFKEVQLSAINYEFLDSLILTIFALRIGDQFHTLAEENLTNENEKVRQSAHLELIEITPEQIETSSNMYLQSFAKILDGKSTIRGYHIKALEVAAFEIKKAHLSFENDSISQIILHLCKTDEGMVLASLFNT